MPTPPSVANREATALTPGQPRNQDDREQTGAPEAFYLFFTARAPRRTDKSVFQLSRQTRPEARKAQRRMLCAPPQLSAPPGDLSCFPGPRSRTGPGLLGARARSRKVALRSVGHAAGAVQSRRPPVASSTTRAARTPGPVAVPWPRSTRTFSSGAGVRGAAAP